MFYLIQKEFINNQFKIPKTKFYLNLEFIDDILKINDFKKLNFLTLYKCDNLNYYYENDKGIKIEFFTKEESTYLYFWDIYYKDYPFIGFEGVIKNKINRFYSYPFIQGFIFNIYHERQNLINIDELSEIKYKPMNKIQLKFLYKLENYILIYDENGEVEFLGKYLLEEDELVSSKTKIDNECYKISCFFNKSGYLILGKKKYTGRLTYPGFESKISSSYKGVLVPLFQDKKIMKKHFILDSLDRKLLIPK
jgi:hypothetical protein